MAMLLGRAHVPARGAQWGQPTLAHPGTCQVTRCLSSAHPDKQSCWAPAIGQRWGRWRPTTTGYQPRQPGRLRRRQPAPRRWARLALLGRQSFSTEPAPKRSCPLLGLRAGDTGCPLITATFNPVLGRLSLPPYPPTPRSSLHPLSILLGAAPKVAKRLAPAGLGQLQTPPCKGQAGLSTAPSLPGQPPQLGHCCHGCPSPVPAGGTAVEAEPGLPLGESGLRTPQGPAPAKHGEVKPSAPHAPAELWTLSPLARQDTPSRF